MHFMKRQVHKMHVFNMFITPVCVTSLIQLRWLKTKSLYDTMKFRSDALKFALLLYGKLSHYKYSVFPSVFDNIITA